MRNENCIAYYASQVDMFTIPDGIMLRFHHKNIDGTTTVISQIVLSPLLANSLKESLEKIINSEEVNKNI